MTDKCAIALCLTSEISLSDLRSSLSSYHPDLSTLVPISIPVPSTPAHDPDELKIKTPIWPVTYSPIQPRPNDIAVWTDAKKAWVAAGIQRVLELALEAKEKNEIPVGCFVTSPPEPLWPNTDAFIPPTPGLRTQSTDSRNSQSHPLRHATLNTIASIADLRTRPPFSQMQPTRNGADYLLTSLSLFVTHEPCVMCCMALLHSRVREVFYVYKSENGGGFESGFGVHGRRDLNHRFDVWKWVGGVEERFRGLQVGDGVEV